MFDPCCQNKGADQLCSYCIADLRLCFRLGKHPEFSHAMQYCRLRSMVAMHSDEGYDIAVHLIFMLDN